MSNASSEGPELKTYIGLPLSRDIERTKLVLGEWFAEKIPEAKAVDVVSMKRPKGNGGSSETWVTTLNVRTGREVVAQEYVVRMKPREFRMFWRENFEEQYRFINFLGAETDVPVPAIPFYEPDPAVIGVPFWVMEKVQGEVPSDDPPYHIDSFLSAATVEQRRKLWRSGLAAATKVAKVDIARMPRIVDLRPNESGLEENLRNWTEAMDWACQGKPSPILRRTIDWLWTNMPVRRDTGLSWGDCRIGNMIFRNWECAAVIDWDTITLAGPQLDLAHWLLMDEYFTIGLGLPPLPGMGSRDETIALWEEFTGFSADQLAWHEVLAAFRLEINGVRGMSMLPAEICAKLTFEDGDTVLTRQLRRVLLRVAGIRVE
jgi:aminoglycoside phosphotransferase (APT) family kinase protein